MAKSDKELEELIKRVKSIAEKISNEDEEEDMEEFKEKAFKMINQSKKSIVLATEDGSMFAGKGGDVMATIAAMIHSLINSGDVPAEPIIEACLRGITDKEKPGKVNLERVNLVLEILKQMTE